MTDRFVLSIDAGTTSVRAMLVARDGRIVRTAQRGLRQIYPGPGLVEHDASEIWSLCRSTVAEAVAGLPSSDIDSVAVANQRETALLWDRITGAPLCNAIVWQDRRTSGLCDSLRRDGFDEIVFGCTGLHIDPYFSGTKIRWMMDHVPGARDAVADGRAIVGTIDSWIVWNLTGGRVHATDHTNASRTMLFDIRRLEWSRDMLDLLGVPESILPVPCPTGHVFGSTDPAAVGFEAPIAASMGDQQAALLGQQCLREGDVKITFGTGGFLLMNIGDEPRLSRNGLLTTVARTAGGRTSYAIEGSIYIAGAAVQWLRDELQIVEEAKETEEMAESVPDAGGCTIVPAFTGLGAPHWDQGARGMILGLTRGTNRCHLARAALESIAFQACEVIRAMGADSGKRTAEIRVDGGASANNFLCKFLADISGVRVARPKVIESTALGAALEAGITTGLWSGTEDLAGLWGLDREFVPYMDQDDRDRRMEEWSEAVECAKAWSRIHGPRRCPADHAVQPRRLSLLALCLMRAYGSCDPDVGDGDVLLPTRADRRRKRLHRGGGPTPSDAAQRSSFNHSAVVVRAEGGMRPAQPPLAGREGHPLRSDHPGVRIIKGAGMLAYMYNLMRIGTSDEDPRSVSERSRRSSGPPPVLRLQQ